MSTRHRPRTRSAAKLAWPRFWARQFDHAICWWIVIGVVASLGMTSPIRGRNLIIALALGPILVGVLHLIYEVLLLTLLGTTIGKSVFGLRVQTQYGKRAEFARVFGRSAGVWLKGSYAYVLFPLPALLAWKKSHDELRFKGMTYWDEHAETEVRGVRLPIWHLSAGAALAIAAFGMIILWQATGRGDNAAIARANASSKPISPATIQPPPLSTGAAAPPAREPTAAEAQDARTGAIQNGNAVFPANGKSFVITAPPARPSANKSAEELATWAALTYPYFKVDGPERRAMFAWMVAGTRAGLPRGAALALGLDTVFSGRENRRGVCWPVDLPPERIAKEVAGSPGKGALGIRCDR